MVADIARYTNMRIDMLAQKYKTKSATVAHTCPEEIKALMGILIQSGAKQDNRITVAEMWSKQHGSPLYRSAMNEKRFNFLLRSLRFDDHTTRNERMKTDKLASWRNTWECFLDNCQKNYVPGNAITVDEHMVGFRGRCPFCYYMPNKPTKYGIKINMACDVRNSYMLNGIADLAKHRRP
ncbi:piggyBac transposable element-derived protein 4-like [Palaemon carinicauda]|uniref:piggyBac transposable element-derived protein 4-like n=1 Tax=Palaemon carinicauda TaxID=392227 RepID=UPI0035B5945F